MYVPCGECREFGVLWGYGVLKINGAPMEFPSLTVDIAYLKVDGFNGESVGEVGYVKCLACCGDGFVVAGKPYDAVEIVCLRCDGYDAVRWYCAGC